MKDITITIDGGSGVGKGTITKALAKNLSYSVIDSGSMYRTISYFINRDKIDVVNNLDYIFENIKFSYEDKKLMVNGEEVETLPIRTPEISQLTSKYAKNKNIRNYITTQIRNIMSQGGFILEGRDAGSVIYPEAEVKFYIDCPMNIRAMRRIEDYKRQGILNTLQEVEAELEERDHRDKTRDTDPLIVPKNAYIIMNDDSRSFDETIEIMKNIAQKYISI